MSKSIIVTINAGSISDDFLIPADVALQELSATFLNGLKNMSPREFADKKYLLFLHERQGLMDLSKTLADYGICEGAILDVIFAEEYHG